MTATPHNGKEADFQLFMALLDGDRFEGRFREGAHKADVSDMLRRLTKEELKTFDGRDLFPPRFAYTVNYKLSDAEADLYEAVTDYVRNEMNRAERLADDDQRRNNVGFALQILQRRLASSPAAIHESLCRRRERLERRLEEERLLQRGREVRLGAARELTAYRSDFFEDVDDRPEDEIEAAEERLVDSATAAQTISELKAGKAQAFICLLTGVPVERTYIQQEGKAGRLTVRLMAIVAEGKRGRVYLPPDPAHEKVATDVEGTELVSEARSTFLSGATPTRAMVTGGVCSAYGLSTWGHLFTARQLIALTTFSDLVLKARARAVQDAEASSLDLDPTSLANGGTGAEAYADAVAVYLCLALDRLADRGSSLCGWDSGYVKIRNTFGRQALPMVWDYVEGNPFCTSTGNWISCGDWIVEVIRQTPSKPDAIISMEDAADTNKLPRAIIATDPPYYDNISYADLSDFFYAWLRRTLRDRFRVEFSTVSSPKAKELVATPYRFSGGQQEAERFFMTGMTRALDKMAWSAVVDVPVTLYYAFKQAEVEKEGVVSTGWATFLQAVLGAGFQVDGTWPARTELGHRMITHGRNALASSIVLVCRKRSADAPSVTRGDFLQALRSELPAALHTLQEAAIAPVDMAQASIGPGMAVFSRYKEVLEADDTRMSVREALRIINAELDEYLARQEGDYDSWTRFAVTWFQQHQFGTGRYGEAETLAKARDVAVQGVVEAGILEARAGNVRLLKREELPDGYEPFRDNRQTVWEGCQHLIKRLEREGEEGAARLAKQLGYQADMARDLAYRLYQLCERNKWAEEARAYNGLIESWREIIKIRDTLPDETAPGPAQAELAV
jgi:putative DNA methylase